MIRLGGQSEFFFLRATGTKKFVDDTLVAGPDYVQYTVQGQRSDSTGPMSPIFTVNFGKAPDGSRFARGSYAGMAGSYAPAAAWIAEIPAPAAAANGNGQTQRALARH